MAKSCPLLFHYTSDKLLYPILESGCLIPGGRTKHRSHVFLSRSRVSDTGVIPDNFKKRMTNICIELDGPAMLRDGLKLYISNANVVLCPHSIEIKYIIAAKYFGEPRHTLYKRPSDYALGFAWGKDCVCTYCHKSYVFGTQWCLSNCKVPLTTHAVQDHIAFLPNPSARVDELWRVYGLTTKSLQDLVDEDRASSIHPTALLMSGEIGTYRYYGDPKNKRKASPPPTPPTAEAGASPPYAPPTAEAGAGRPTQQPTHKPAAPRAPRVRFFPTWGDPAIRIGCAHMKNEAIHHCNHGATKRNYSNHTHRYQQDSGYRNDCQSHVPTTPEHLYYVNGDYVR